MLSIIVCSRNTKLPKQFTENIKNTIGIDYEIICIDNSKQKYSIFSAYNEGIKLSKYPYLCLVHEDVFFHTQNWGEKIIAHLQKPETGIIGIAGGDLAPKVPAMWSVLNPSANIIQSDQTGKVATKKIYIPNNYDQSARSVVLLDGVLLSMKRRLFDTIKFDESLGGFHGYDADISIQSILAGYFNYVIFDISIEHFSTGNMNGTYYRNLLKVFKKWENNLPLVEHSISTKDFQLQLPIIEDKNLLRLVKRLTRTGFSTKVIVELTTYYAHLIGSKKISHTYLVLLIRILFIRISSSIRNKNNY